MTYKTLEIHADFPDTVSRDIIERWGLGVLEEFLQHNTISPNTPSTGSPRWAIHNLQQWPDEYKVEFIIWAAEMLYERDAKPRMCSWRDCKYHTDDYASDALLRASPAFVTSCPSAKVKKAFPKCKGCGEVRYCSRKCLRSDWVEGGHKADCGKRLK